MAGFFATVPADGRLDLIPLLRTQANGHPALAAYFPDDNGQCHGYGIMVFTIADGAVATITGFPDPRLFSLFGLPATSARMSSVRDPLRRDDFSWPGGSV